jgi:hypothetical protein
MAKVVLCGNPEGVPPKDLDEIVGAANLPSGTVCLIVGDPDLGDAHQGLCVPRRYVQVLGNIGGLEHHLEDAWDCGVLIHPKWAVRQASYPAYFAYLLGHELGHAKTALSDPGLVVMEALIFDVPAVSGRDGWHQADLPHERRYDQFGLAVADQTHGLAALHQEVQSLLASGIEQDEERLKRMLTLEPRLGLDGLWEELAEFSLPCKQALVDKWTAAMSSMSPGFTRFLADPHALWEQN